MVRTKSSARKSRPCSSASVGASGTACTVTKGTGYTTYSAGGRGASAAGPEIPKEAGPRRRAQRRGARDEGGIPTRSMRPHLRTDARPYAERGIAGGAGMRRSAANAPRATAGCIGPNAERTDAKSRAPLSGRPRRQSFDCRGGRTQRGVRFSRGSTVGPMQPADSGTANRSTRKSPDFGFRGSSRQISSAPQSNEIGSAPNGIFWAKRKGSLSGLPDSSDWSGSAGRLALPLVPRFWPSECYV
jgi:hypothetical protein